jgi:adenosyl cobinamide kinase/adenosyl cobinamide phosphate guanylyltransferase
MELSRLTKLPLRSAWKHEAIDFTNWLAGEENLQLLSETIGVELMNAQTEVGVGLFHVDILAEDETGHKVVIENQLESTNHDHLGKLITYASGLGAEVVIWIVSRAREEHEQAINWLNEHTTEEANFFLIEIEVWQIGDSSPAPRFNVIAKPNDWAKTVKQSGSGNKVTELKLQQQSFFESLREYGSKNAKYIKSWQTPRAQHWYTIRVGSSQAKLSATINSKDNKVAVEVYINDSKDLFHKLHANKDEIESKLGMKLDWQELPDKKASRIIVTHSGDFASGKDADGLISWITETADNFAKVFPKYL